MKHPDRSIRYVKIKQTRKEQLNHFPNRWSRDYFSGRKDDFRLKNDSWLWMRLDRWKRTEIKMVSFSVILIYSWPGKTEMVDLFILEKMLIEKILQFDWIRKFRALICERLSHCLQKRIGDQKVKSNETIFQKLLEALIFWKILNLLWFFDPIQYFSRETWSDLVYQSIRKTLRNEIFWIMTQMDKETVLILQNSARCGSSIT